jgi:type IV pilus assembly protein PilE
MPPPRSDKVAGIEESRDQEKPLKPIQRGFTLIELMITCAIIAILAAVAYPSYSKHVQKSARTAAKAQMLDLANREQQYLLSNRSYATKTQLETAGFSLSSDVSSRYSYTITTASSPPAFTITFTPTGSQSADGSLTLNHEGSKAPADKW